MSRVVVSGYIGETGVVFYSDDGGRLRILPSSLRPGQRVGLRERNIPAQPGTVVRMTHAGASILPDGFESLMSGPADPTFELDCRDDGSNELDVTLWDGGRFTCFPTTLEWHSLNTADHVPVRNGKLARRACAATPS